MNKKKNRLSSYAREEPGGLVEITRLTIYIYIYNIYSRGGSRNTFGLEAQVLMLFTLGSLHACIILYCASAVCCTNVCLFF